jgi:hypothetical protein
LSYTGSVTNFEQAPADSRTSLRLRRIYMQAMISGGTEVFAGAADTCRRTRFVAGHCLRSRHYVNVIVAGKQPRFDWLSADEAVIHCTRGAGIWEWASNDSPGSWAVARLDREPRATNPGNHAATRGFTGLHVIDVTERI